MRCAASECSDATATMRANTDDTIRPVWDVAAPKEMVNRNASPVNAIVGTCQSSVSHC